MARKNGLAHRLYVGELSYDFIGKRKIWYLVSTGLILLSLIGLFAVKLNLGIEFKGGADFQAPTTVNAQTVGTFRQAVMDLHLDKMDDTVVQTIGNDKVRIQTRVLDTEKEVPLVHDAIAKAAGVDGNQVTSSFIGASWGKQITEKGLMALGVFLVLVMLMIGLYFRESKMAVAAIVALLHDLMITTGIYALTRFSVTPATLIGILTILGYSLYDTVVVFDKVKELTQGITKQNRTYAQAANKAVNQVLVRSLNTTLIGVLPVAALLFAGVFILGSGPLKDLGLALFIGMIIGAYSSVFLATPLLVDMKRTEPELKDHEARLARRVERIAPKADVTVAAVEEEAGTSVTALPVKAAAVGVVDAERLAQVAPSPAGRPQPTKKPRSQRRK